MTTVRDLIKMIGALALADYLGISLEKHHSILYQKLEKHGYRFRYTVWIYRRELTSTH